MIKEILIAFLVGGLFCLPAQILIDKTAMTPARILVLYVCLGVFLSAVGIYGPLIDFAGRGAATPLTGFGHALAEGVKKGVAEKGFVGIFTGGISGAAGGIAAAILFGWLSALFFQSRPKK